uniref:(northern house mosquito) hypothetical protein n=1 Tax=Culex pipiens TaxID=7175 RepID=A0A8D8F0F4_CULPI
MFLEVIISSESEITNGARGSHESQSKFLFVASFFGLQLMLLSQSVSVEICSSGKLHVTNFALHFFLLVTCLFLDNVDFCGIKFVQVLVPIGLIRFHRWFRFYCNSNMI